jgi:hypothetical protein
VSWPALDWCARLGPEVKVPLRSLLWAMAYHANRDSGLVTAGVRLLGPEAGVSPATAARLLVEAQQRGLVELVREAAGSRPAWHRLPCFVSHHDETQAAAGRPVSVSSAAASVSPWLRRNPNPTGRSPMTEQQRLAALAAQHHHPGADRRPPDPTEPDSGPAGRAPPDGAGHLELASTASW